MNTAGTDSPRVVQQKPKLRVSEVLPLWNSEWLLTEIAEQFGVTTTELRTFARANYFPKRINGTRVVKQRIVDPTPEEIAARAAEIRAKKGEQEKDRLNDFKVARVEIRQYAYNSRTGIFSEM